jgi:hypothetical protein
MSDDWDGSEDGEESEGRVAPGAPRKPHLTAEEKAEKRRRIAVRKYERGEE